MGRWFFLTLFIVTGGSAVFYLGFMRGQAVRSQTPICDHYDRVLEGDQRRVTIARPRQPQRYDDGRVAPHEATSTHKPLGAAPPALVP